MKVKVEGLRFRSLFKGPRADGAVNVAQIAKHQERLLCSIRGVRKRADKTLGQEFMGGGSEVVFSKAL